MRKTLVSIFDIEMVDRENVPSLCTSQGKGKDTTQTGNGVMFDVTSYPACGSVGPESGLSSLVCVAEK